jgi:hypothetical protein
MQSKIKPTPWKDKQEKKEVETIMKMNKEEKSRQITVGLRLPFGRQSPRSWRELFLYYLISIGTPRR